MTVSLEQRFWTKVAVVDDEDSCWLWLGGSSSGYGYIEIDGRWTRAHRVSYSLEHDAIPSHLFILHTCDVKLCVRPKHLYAGTHAQNMKDRDDMGRTASGDRVGMRTHPESRMYGERAPASKLTWEDARALRTEFSRGKVTKADLARRFGVSHHAIRSVISGRTWKEETYVIGK